MTIRARRLLTLVSALMSITCFATPSHAQPSVDGQWTSVFNFNSIEAIHAIMLPTGKVMYWQTWTDSIGLYDPVNGTFEDAANPNVNIFCAGHAWLPDGRLMVVGGHISNYNGEEESNIYDPFTNTWANNIPDMNATNGVPNNQAGRWYPSVTTLGNGDILALSGDMTQQGVTNPLPQVYNLETNTWRDLTTAMQFDISEYPRTFLAPDGRVLMVSDYGNNTQLLDTTGSGSWEVIDQTLDSDLHNYGPGVMYDTGKIAYLGGGNTPTQNVSMIDLNDANPEWTYGADDMAQPRRQNDATILADGTVLITGGTSVTGWNDPNGAIATAEVWDPESEQVTQVAAASSVYRGYHSTATLLPDGRVLITGGDHDHGGFQQNLNAEIYSPAYLFNGDRPTVTSAPDSAELGDSIFVETPDADDIEKAIMIYPGATTHSQNWGQRANHLDFTVGPGGLNIQLPANGNEAPPGYYMLFLINDNGVPSVAEWLLTELPSNSVPGDADGDGDVDLDDFNILSSNMYTNVAGGGSEGDFDEDGDVDFDDYITQAQNMGFGGPDESNPASLPEPTTLLMLGAGMSLLPRRRGSR